MSLVTNINPTLGLYMNTHTIRTLLFTVASVLMMGNATATTLVPVGSTSGIYTGVSSISLEYLDTLLPRGNAELEKVGWQTGQNQKICCCIYAAVDPATEGETDRSREVKYDFKCCSADNRLKVEIDVILPNGKPGKKTVYWCSKAQNNCPTKTYQQLDADARKGKCIKTDYKAE